MSFIRYEIRTYYDNEDNLYGDNFDYVPFDSFEELFEYIKSHKELVDDNSSYVCKIRLYPDFDECERKETIKEWLKRVMKYNSGLIKF